MKFFYILEHLTVAFLWSSPLQDVPPENHEYETDSHSDISFSDPEHDRRLTNTSDLFVKTGSPFSLKFYKLKCIKKYNNIHICK
jgi:hypothetical protein